VSGKICEKAVSGLTGKEEGVEKAVDEAEVAGEEDHDGLGGQEDERAEESLASDVGERAALALLLCHYVGVASLFAHLLSAPLEESRGIADERSWSAPSGKVEEEKRTFRRGRRSRTPS
jgi:hypothetical protein